MKKYSIAFSLLFTVIFISCSKEWLNEPSSKQLSVPGTVRDVRALLDNSSILNGFGAQFLVQELAETSTDNYTMNNYSLESFESFMPLIPRVYRYETDIFMSDINLRQWNVPYQRIFFANVALETLEKLDRKDADVLALRGEALFHRANSYFWLSQLFVAPYDPNTSDTRLGLPLRLNSDPNPLSKRSTVEETYQAIIKDLTEATTILPLTNEGIRPARSAGNALLSRVWLSMNRFDSAWKYADECLALSNELLDYNIIDTMLMFPVPKNNKEVLFSDISYSSVFSPFFCQVNADLYSSYEENDLRKYVFFKQKEDGNYSFNGGYDGSFALFGGISTNEVYLAKAECAVRAGRDEEARSLINTLLSKRYRTGEFIPVTASSMELLDRILNERRKELCFRGLRWIDIRRLNLAGAGISIVHKLNGQTFTLPANDPKFVMPIPPDVINQTGMQQNKR